MERIQRYERCEEGSNPSGGSTTKETMLYNIWSEGFRTTGEEGKAHYVGFGYGYSFQEACDNFFSSFSEEELNTKFGGYNSKYGTIWGCNLFDNEVDARKSIG